MKAIAAEIMAGGPIPFARFMELALYHPIHGYYMRMGSDDGARHLGGDGDFYTSSDVHAVFGRLVVRQLRQIDELLGHPTPLTLIEMGPGKGALARDMLQCCETDPELISRLRYLLIERSPAMRAAQQRTLDRWAPIPGLVSWAESLESLPSESLRGVFLSNELLDAFPVHRVRIVEGTARELAVDYQEGRFVERALPLTNQALRSYLDRLRDMDITLAEGQTADINLLSLAWMREVARVLAQGIVLTIDYGHTAQDLFGPERRNGTLLGYRQQMLSEDPYQDVGLQDLTAHVDFTAVATAGDEAGLAVTGFTNQMSFLMSLGVEQEMEGLEPGSREFQSIIQLLRPEGMGRTFKVLIQHKGLPCPTLEGLRFKPFFGSALAPSQAMGNGREAIGRALPSSPLPIAHSLSPRMS
ncbi:MAG: SAM-dependent methyltransferase [Nitrospirae bacterium]|nr:SAM-dependent methyltransferase [Nitrospirota bacterium]